MKNDLAANSMRSGELAQAAGVSRDALRYYERHHLLPAAERAQNGYRRYPPQALARVRLIRAALGIGFTVEELAEIFSARDRGWRHAGRSTHWRFRSRKRSRRASLS